MKRKLTLLLMLVMALGLTACSGSEEAGNEEGKPSEEQSTSNEAPGIEDGSMDVCFASEPESIDPAKNTSVDGAIMIGHAFEGLIRWEDDGEGNAVLEPGAAESWDISDDGLEYVFHLREDAKWSDGKPVTANDFKFAWDRLVNPETGADYEYMLDMVDGYEEKKLNIEAVDEKTFKVVLSSPTAFFEEICAFPATYPVREDMVSSDEWTFGADTYLSNGPYVLENWEHNAKISFVKNPEYYKADEITCEKIVFHLMDDANAMYAAYRSGELDFIQELPQDEIAGLLDSGELKVKPYVGTYFVCFNTQEKPFDDPRVRQAFSLVIDRNFIVNQVTGRGEVVAGGFVPSGVYDADGADGDDFRTKAGDYYSLDEAEYEANCEKARELLKEAGFENGEGFPVVEYLYNTNENHRAIGEALQNMWQTELGVQVSLQNQDWAVFLTERKEGNFSIARHGWIADYNDPMTFIDMWISSSGNNDSQYQNPEYDKIVAEAKSEEDPVKRMELMHQAENLAIGEDAIVAPIYFYTNPYMMKPNIEGVFYTPLGYWFFNQASGL